MIMMSRRRFLPWIQSAWRRGGAPATPYVVLALIFSTSAVTLFIRAVENQSLDDSDASDDQDPNTYNVRFVAPDPAIIADNESRIKKALLKQAPLNDSIAEIFNEKAFEVKDKVNDKVEKIHQKSTANERKPNPPKNEITKTIIAKDEEDDDEDFTKLAAEEFVPPNDLMNVLNKVGPVIQNSFFDIAKKVVPVLAQTINGVGDNNSPMNIIGNALPLLLGGDSKNDPSSSSGLESAIAIAKLFLGAKSGIENRKDSDNKHILVDENQLQKTNKNNENQQPKNPGQITSDFITSKDTGVNPNNAKIEKNNSRLPLSIDSTTQDDLHREKKNNLGTIFKLMENVKKKKKSSKILKWIRDSLNEKGREKSAKDIQNIYDLLMKTNRLFKRDACDNVVVYSKDSPMWKEDDFQGTQFVCEDLDFGVYFKEHCVIYSFGIGSDWSFEEAMEKKGCEVWAFDQFAKKPNHDSKIHFYNDVALGAKDEEITVNGKLISYYTLKTIIRKLKHTKRNITYLKINIIDEEWPILEQILNETPLVLNNVLQIGIKTHLHTAMLDHSLYAQYFNLLHQLPSLGYQLFTTVKVQDNLDDVYREPFTSNKEVSLTNYAAYLRL